MMCAKQLSIFSIALLVASGAYAQQWGMGAYGAMQGCPYKNAAAPVIESNATLDEAKDKKKENDEIDKAIKQMQREMRTLDSKLRQDKVKMGAVLQRDAVDGVTAHIDSNQVCSKYVGAVKTQIDAVKINGRDEEDTSPLDVPEPFTAASWQAVCNQEYSGSIKAEVCSEKKLQNDFVVGANVGECKKALKDYSVSTRQKARLANDILYKKGQMEANKELIKTLVQNYQDELRDQQQNGNTEGGICYECMAQGNGGSSYQKPETDWAGVATSAVAGGLEMLLGYQTNKMVAQNNASIGWATNPVPFWGYGIGNVSNAIYGALGGGMGSGAFGCSGVNGGPQGMMGPYGMGGGGPNGMWGYPNSYYGNNGMGGGGAYLPGMGPWGQAGPWGNGQWGGGGGIGGYAMGGYPAAGIAMGGVIGGGLVGGGYPAGGYAAGGFAGGGYPMGGYAAGGYPIGGALGGGGIIGGALALGGGGYAAGGYPVGGFAAGGGYPMAGGYPIGGALGGGGIIGGGLVGGGYAAGGYPMGGFAAGGGYPMGSALGGGLAAGGVIGGGLAIGGYPGLALGGGLAGGGLAGGLVGGGLAAGGLAGGGLAGGPVGSLQYQSQIAQQQLQQYQQAIQQQQQAIQQQAQQQQVVSSLTSEINGLIQRIYQVQSGYGSTGYLGGGVSGGIGGIGTGIGLGTSYNSGYTLGTSTGIGPTPLGTGSTLGTLGTGGR